MCVRGKKVLLIGWEWVGGKRGKGLVVGGLKGISVEDMWKISGKLMKGVDSLSEM